MIDVEYTVEEFQQSLEDLWGVREVVPMTEGTMGWMEYILQTQYPLHLPLPKIYADGGIVVWDWSTPGNNIKLEINTDRSVGEYEIEGTLCDIDTGEVDRWLDLSCPTGWEVVFDTVSVKVRRCA